MKFKFFLLLLLTSMVWLSLSAQALPGQRHPDFRVPQGLQGRVSFWIDIFSRYGENQAVIHHRAFPQAVYTVLDFSHEARLLSPVLLERYRKKKVKDAIDQIQKQLSALSRGEPARTDFEKHLQKSLEFLGPGLQKYREAADPELIRSQTGIKEKYADALSRSGRYMHLIENIFVKEHGLPVELTRLPFVESSFDYRAYSSVGAAGIWQFMRSTGKIYMRINNLIDERRDIVSSTRAAAKYLRSAYGQLQTWPLALTSYNHGVAGVAKKVRHLGTSDIVKIVEHRTERVFGFASNNFYPEFLAALEIYDNPQRYFPGVKIEPPLRIAEHVLPFPMSVNHISRNLGISIEELKDTNYALSATIWSGRAAVPKGYALKVPQSYAAKLVNLRTPDSSGPASSGSPPATTAASSVYGGAVYKVRRGDSLISIARKFNVTVAELRKLNSLKSDVLVVGQTLTVKSRENVSVPEEKPVLSKADEAKTSTTYKVAKTHKVVSGDTLWSIAAKYKVSVDALRKANKLKSSKLRPGQSLKIP